ncbi:MAG: BlaI/MecI/CopY family transcriptional regulator [Candidatus Latescibacterota bacterium]
MQKLDIGKGQMKVLRVLWERKRATAQEITDILNKTDPIKFSTVSTFLRTLVHKGVAGYDVEQRTYIYYPLVKEDSIANHAVKDLIDHVFEGSIQGFVSFILKKKYVSPEELAKIQEMLDNEER